MDNVFYYTKLCRKSRKFVKRNSRMMKASGVMVTRIDDLLESGNIPKILEHVEIVPSFQHRGANNRITMYEADEAYKAVTDFIASGGDSGEDEYPSEEEVHLPPGTTMRTHGPRAAVPAAPRYSAENPPDPASIFAEDWKKDDGAVKDEEIEHLISSRPGMAGRAARGDIEDPPPARPAGSVPRTTRPNPRGAQPFKTLGR